MRLLIALLGPLVICLTVFLLRKEESCQETTTSSLRIRDVVVSSTSTSGNTTSSAANSTPSSTNFSSDGNINADGEEEEEDDDTINTPPKHIWLLGERNSGTNFVEEVLETAFFPRYAAKGNESESRRRYPFGTNIPGIGFKHVWRHEPFSSEELKTLKKLHGHDTLWVMVVRSPCDWASAMYRLPYHMCDPFASVNRIVETARGEEWEYDAVNASEAKQKAMEMCRGVTIGYDNKRVLDDWEVSRLEYFSGSYPWWDNVEARTPNQDFIYPDGVFQLREHKLRLMKQIIDWVAGPQRVVVVNLNQVELSPWMLVHNIAKKYGLELNHQEDATMKMDLLEPSAKGRQHDWQCLTREEHSLALSKINWNLERWFGFSELDCHRCIIGAEEERDE